MLVDNLWKRIHNANTFCITVQPENGLGGRQHCRAMVIRLPDHGDPQRRTGCDDHYSPTQLIAGVKHFILPVFPNSVSI